MNMQVPRVGVGVIISKGDTILLGKRINSHGHNSWAPPGGHLEFLESPEDCARREVLEETGIRIQNIRPILFTNDIFQPDNKHYITIFMAAEYESGQPALLEPHKCTAWQWFTWDTLPNPLFLSFVNFLKLKNEYVRE